MYRKLEETPKGEIEVEGITGEGERPKFEIIATYANQYSAPGGGLATQLLHAIEHEGRVVLARQETKTDGEGNERVVYTLDLNVPEEIAADLSGEGVAEKAPNGDIELGAPVMVEGEPNPGNPNLPNAGPPNQESTSPAQPNPENTGTAAGGQASPEHQF